MKWKYLQTVVMGLYAVCEQKLANPDRVLSPEVSCGLLIVVTSSTCLKRKDILKQKKAVSPDHQNPQPSMYIDKCTLYTYTV